MIRNYRELNRITSFEDRFNYLQLHGEVGSNTFGFDRIFNQMFYRSIEWKQLRNQIIVRDNGCDLGIKGREIFGRIIIHHMNPLRLEDIVDSTEYLMNPDYLICVSHNTHNAIHYGNSDLLMKDPIERRANDTCPWK